MGGPGSGLSTKRKKLTRRFSQGALADADARAPEVRVVREGVEQIAEDRGGEAAQSFLARRMAARAMHLDQMLARFELELLEGRAIDTPTYLAGCATWHRYANSLGLTRKAKPVRTLSDVMHEGAGGDGGN
jgi:hypothetical protein